MQLKSARGAQKTRQESKRLQNYSKSWVPGDTMHVFLPIYRDDEEGTWEIAVGAVWGHRVGDIKTLGLKTAFIPSLTEFDSETGEPIGNPDITYQFSRIAPLFLKGQRTIEEAEIVKKKWPTEDMRKTALEDIAKKYDTKNNLKAVRPVVDRATLLITTEVLAIKYANGVPVKDSASVYSFPMSDQCITQLYSILGNDKYAPADGDEFLEIEYNYAVDPDKAKSSRDAKPNGLTPEYKMITQFNEIYNQIKGMFDLVSTDSETIARRATRKVEESKIRNALMQYCILHCESIDAITGDSVDTLMRNAPVVKELGLLGALTNPELTDKISAEFEKIKASLAVPTSLPDLSESDSSIATMAQTQAATEAAPVQQAQPISEAAPSPVQIDEPIDLGVPATDLGNTSAPKITDLLNNPHRDQMDQGELAEVNIEMI